MENSENSKKIQFWSSHIEKAKRFEGGTKRYCEEQGLNIHTFKYWSQKISFKQSFKPENSFIPVTIEKSKSRNQLPDPKWVAEILFELYQRIQ